MRRTLEDGSLLLEVVRIGVAAILLSAAAAKIVGPSSSLRAVFSHYRIIPQRLLGPVTVAVLVSEPMIGIGLLLSRAAWILVLAALLFLGFALTAIITLRTESSGVECGCLGSTVRLRVTRTSVAANLSVSGLALVASLISLGGDPALLSTSASLRCVLVLAGCALGALYWLFLYAATVADLMVSD